MYRVLEIDHLKKPSATEKKISQETLKEVAKDIANLANMNIASSNDGTYDAAAMEKLSTSKTYEATLAMLECAYTVCIYDTVQTPQKLIACGFVKMQDGRYFSKSLHVHPDYRGQGLAVRICDLRENHLRHLGVTEVYIESLKFENTVRFHKRRGFEAYPPYRELRNTVLMRKVLLWSLSPDNGQDTPN